MKALSNFCYESADEARGVLLADLVVDLQKGYRGFHQFSSLESGVFAELENDIFTIYDGFKSDLCSPAFRVFGKWVGTWSTEREAFGSFIHDAARRVRRLPCCPFNRKDTDDFFFDALALKGSLVTKPYHYAVSSFIGTAFIKLTEKRSIDCYCKTHQPK